MCAALWLRQSAAAQPRLSPLWWAGPLPLAGLAGLAPSEALQQCLCHGCRQIRQTCRQAANTAQRVKGFARRQPRQRQRERPVPLCRCCLLRLLALPAVAVRAGGRRHGGVLRRWRQVAGRPPPPLVEARGSRPLPAARGRLAAALKPAQSSPGHRQEPASALPPCCSLCTALLLKAGLGWFVRLGGFPR